MRRVLLATLGWPRCSPCSPRSEAAEQGRMSPPATAQPSARPTPPTSAHFRDVAAKRGLHATDVAGGAVLDDFDGDGDLDLYVSNFGANRLYRNDLDADGRAHFVDVAVELGVTEPAGQGFGAYRVPEGGAAVPLATTPP